jgi:16S rRNA G966 N2-methylase RsmD
MNKIHEITKQLRLSSIEVYLFHIDPSHLERFSLILIDPPYPTRFFLTLINSSYLEEILSNPNRSN